MAHRLYRHSLALLTDLYQLTMAYGYWKLGMADRTHAAFHLFYRREPFHGDHTVACGLGSVVDLVDDLRFDAADLEYLATVTGSDGGRLFDDGFLRYLGDLRLSCDLDAVAEGEVVFAHEPLVRVVGPLLQCQILETALLNLINFETLIATKAARICQVAGDRPVLEFGLRRAQGIDGGVSAARAAVIGGCAATSNVLAGKLYGIPVKGTHAHSWIMAFDDERTAFDRYADVLPNNCVFLVDTYDTIEGVRRAIAAGRRLRERGHEMVGIRLDSGDLAALSIEARRLLDEAGFPEAVIVASSDLDEHKVAAIDAAGGQVGVFGVGTRLATAWDEPALGGVYKLAAICRPGEGWSPRIKLSDDRLKLSIPGIQQVLRYSRDGVPAGDVIIPDGEPPDAPLAHPREGGAPVRLDADAHRPLLVPVYREGRRVYDPPATWEAREHAAAQRGLFAGITDYPVGLSPDLHQRREAMIEEHRCS